MRDKLGAVVRVDEMASAVALWSKALETAPSFVDGDRWAQFDLGGSRLALAGTDRASNGVALMAKVDDIDQARMARADLAPGPIVEGPHERRFAVEMPSGVALVLYAPR